MWTGCLAGIAETFLIFWIWKKYGIWDFKLVGKKKIAFICLLAVFSVILNILLFEKGMGLILQINWSVAYLILSAAAGIDQKKQVIPNRLIIAGFILRTLVLAGLFLADRQMAMEEGLRSVAGLVVSLMVMLLLSFLSRHGIGYGDVKLFSWLGYCLGLSMTYNILFYSALFAAAAGVWLMLVKKADKRTQMPFGPFIWCGSYLVFCMMLLS